MTDLITQIADIAGRRQFVDATDMSNCETIQDYARRCAHPLALKAHQIAGDYSRSAADRMKAVAALFANDSVRAA